MFCVFSSLISQQYVADDKDSVVSIQDWDEGIVDVLLPILVCQSSRASVCLLQFVIPAAVSASCLHIDL